MANKEGTNESQTTLLNFASLLKHEKVRVIYTPCNILEYILSFMQKIKLIGHRRYIYKIIDFQIMLNKYSLFPNFKNQTF